MKIEKNKYYSTDISAGNETSKLLDKEYSFFNRIFNIFKCKNERKRNNC